MADMRLKQPSGAACLAGALLLGLGLSPLALAGPDERVRQIEKASAQAKREQRRLTRETEQTEAAMRALNEALVRAAKDSENAALALTEAQARLARAKEAADLASLRRNEARASVAARSAVLAMASGEENAVLALIGAAGLDEALRNSAATDRNAFAANRLSADLARERAEMLRAETAFAVEEAKLAGLMAQLRARRAHLSVETARAQARANALANEARSLRHLAAGSLRRDRDRPSTAVASGDRRAPSNGRIVHVFGASRGNGALHQGETITTRANATVLAPANGLIVYAGAFRSYGKVLILDAGGGYAIVLAGLDRIQTETGQTVLAGQPVGVMGDDQAPTSERAENRSADDAMPAPKSSQQMLYWEVRRHDRPIDPRRWLLSRNQRANQSIVNDRRAKGANEAAPKGANGAQG
jgi:septal ring factor EnvC (AmiA/AmiB activator)